MLAALDRGKAGERYLVNAANWTCADFFARLARVAKVGGPRLSLPSSVQTHAAALWEGLHRAAGRRPALDRVSVEMGQLYWYCDAGKAQRELGLTTRDPQETLADTVRDVRARML